MAGQEMPSMTSSSYTTQTFDLDHLTVDRGDAYGRMEWRRSGLTPYAGADAARTIAGVYQNFNCATPKEEIDMSKSPLRIVRVFLVDKDDRVPVDKRMLHKSDEMLTDATDQELFFGIEVKSILDKHNAYRKSVAWEEKNHDGGTTTRTGLPELRIRDLAMTVTQVAAF